MTAPAATQAKQYVNWISFLTRYVCETVCPKWQQSLKKATFSKPTTFYGLPRFFKAPGSNDRGHVLFCPDYLLVCMLSTLTFAIYLLNRK